MSLRAQHCFLSTLPIVMLMVMLLQLSGCAWRNPAPAYSAGRPGSNAGVSVNGSRVATTATRLVGTPYRYGGTTPKGFDCSGLVYYSYQQAGQVVPRTSAAQFSAASQISFKDARPGDLLFFASRKSVDHVAIYLGDDRFVHAPSNGKQVTVGKMTTPHYRDHFVAAGRLVKGP
jgi:murein DD-endopeptidase